MIKKMAKLVVFEGISGSGKSTLIDAVNARLQSSVIMNWFDNEFVRDVLSDIEEDMKMNRDMFSLSYAMDFWGKYKYYIQPYLNENINLLFHRYIYTPLAHDTVRGTEKSKLERLYMKAKIPDKVIFLNISPKTAWNRILGKRRPSFYECGLDMFCFDCLSEAKRKYVENIYSLEQLYDCFVNFQTLVNKQYINIFSNMDNVLWLEENDLKNNVGKVIQYIID